MITTEIRLSIIIALLILILIIVCSCKTTRNQVNNLRYSQLENGWIGSSFYKPEYESTGLAASWHSGYLIEQKNISNDNYLIFRNYAVKWNKRDTFDIYLHLGNIEESFLERKIQAYNNDNEKTVIEEKGLLDFVSGKLVMNKGVAFSIYKFNFITDRGCWTLFISPNFGLIKQYGPGYHESFEITCNPDLYYGDEELSILLNTIKSDSTFHSRCDEGKTW